MLDSVCMRNGPVGDEINRSVESETYSAKKKLQEFESERDKL